MSSTATAVRLVRFSNLRADIDALAASPLSGKVRRCHRMDTSRLYPRQGDSPCDHVILPSVISRANLRDVACALCLREAKAFSIGCASRSASLIDRSATAPRWTRVACRRSTDITRAMADRSQFAVSVRHVVPRPDRATFTMHEPVSLDERNANSAIVVGITPETSGHPLAGCIPVIGKDALRAADRECGTVERSAISSSSRFERNGSVLPHTIRAFICGLHRPAALHSLRCAKRTGGDNKSADQSTLRGVTAVETRTSSPIAASHM